MAQTFAAVAGASVLLFAAPTLAEPTHRPGGFTTSNTVEVAAPPARVWAALLEPGRWWNGQHSWSGSAANLSLEPRAGGCFCERLADGGSAMHGQVSMAQPNRMLRLNAWLGPLMATGVTGAMTWSLEPAGAGSRVTLTYAVGGLPDDQARAMMAPVDGVQRDWLERLDRYVETGSPEA